MSAEKRRDEKCKKRQKVIDKIRNRNSIPLGRKKPKVEEKTARPETHEERQIRISKELERLDKLREEEQKRKHFDTLARSMAGSPVKVAPFEKSKHLKVRKNLQECLKK